MSSVTKILMFVSQSTSITVHSLCLLHKISSRCIQEEANQEVINTVDVSCGQPTLSSQRPNSKIPSSSIVAPLGIYTKKGQCSQEIDLPPSIRLIPGRLPRQGRHLPMHLRHFRRVGCCNPSHLPLFRYYVLLGWYLQYDKNDNITFSYFILSVVLSP